MRPAREQPQIHAQTYVNMIDHGLDIQTSPSRWPRWLSGRFALGEARDTLHIEARFPGETITELGRRGHVIDRWGEWNELAGHAHGITIDARTGVRSGGGDPRSDGAAIGLSVSDEGAALPSTVAENSNQVTQQI